jgi:hypothetical protein
MKNLKKYLHQDQYLKRGIIFQALDFILTILKEAILQLKISQNVINFLAQEYKDLKILIIHMTILIVTIMLNI